jgi:hypothetical protein
MKKYLVPLAIAAALTFPVSVRADGGSVEVVTDCVGGITITTAGFPEGDGWLVIGGEPQRTFTLNTTVATTWPLSLAGMYDYTVIAIPGNGEAIQGFMDCTSTEAPVVEPPIEPEPAVIAEPVAPPKDSAFEPHPIWPGLELAPPW